MAVSGDHILNLPESVKRDVEQYRKRVESFAAGEGSAVSFRAYRVPMGVYEQRASGHFMVRVRLGAGLATAAQLERIAELGQRFGNGIIHVTTRQDAQIHDVSLEDTPNVLEGLLEVGLSSRGGGGNTVRNVTACPRASVCPKAKFDVAPHAIAVAEYLLQHASSFNLPRKYKIAFSGCSEDCAGASISDLGLFADTRDGKPAYTAYAGGGLGMHPAVGVKIGECDANGEVLQYAQAVKSFFDRHGDRSNKHRARLRYVLDGMGEDAFASGIRDELKDVERTGLEGDIPAIRPLTDVLFPEVGSDVIEDLPANVFEDRSEGRYTIEVALPLGDIASVDLVALSRTMVSFGVGIAVATQGQNLMVPSVPGQSVVPILKELCDIGIRREGQPDPKITACTGAATCKLGMCLSRNLADAISGSFADAGITSRDVPQIKVSGCPNSCGGHHAAAIGLQGGARRHKGRLMPVYKILAGADMTQGRARLGVEVAEVPARVIPSLLASAAKAGKVDQKGLTEIARRYVEIPETVPEDYYRDFGSAEPFTLAGRGPGECGAGVMDVVALDIKEALEAAKLAGSSDDEAYRAILSAARALLPVFGIEPKKDREVFEACRENLVAHGWVAQSVGSLVSAAVDWRMGDGESLRAVAAEIEAFVARVKALFSSLDASLKFRLAPISTGSRVAADEAGPVEQKDLRGVACPMNFVKAKVALESTAVGTIVEVLLDLGAPTKNVPASFAEQGQEVLGVETRGDHTLLRVRRLK